MQPWRAGPTSWTAPLDILRLTPADDVTTVTAQLRELFSRLTQAGQWSQADPKIVVVLDAGAGYDVVRLSFLLADLPIELVGRLPTAFPQAAPRSVKPRTAAPGP